MASNIIGKENAMIKQLQETIAMKDSNNNMPQNITTIRQFLSFQKNQMVLEKKIDALSKELTAKNFLNLFQCQEDLAFLNIERIDLPLLWMDESKKKDNFTGYAFYLFYNTQNIFESEIIEFTSATSFLSIPPVKIANVTPTTNLTVELYYNLIENNSIKKYLKIIDSESESFKFNLIGTGLISVKELISLKQKYFLLNTPSPIELSMFGSVSKSPSNTMNRSLSYSFNSSLKIDQSSCYYGIRINYWYKAMAEFNFCPNILQSNFCRFSAIANFNNIDEISQIIFDGNKFIVYNSFISSLIEPIYSEKIIDINVKCQSSERCAEIIHKSEGPKGQIEFTTKENCCEFIKYFNEYQTSFQTWGVNIDCQQYSTKPSNIIHKVAKTPQLIAHLLTDTSKLQSL